MMGSGVRVPPSASATPPCSAGLSSCHGASEVARRHYGARNGARPAHSPLSPTRAGGDDELEAADPLKRDAAAPAMPPTSTPSGQVHRRAPHPRLLPIPRLWPERGQLTPANCAKTGLARPRWRWARAVPCRVSTLRTTPTSRTGWGQAAAEPPGPGALGLGQAERPAGAAVPDRRTRAGSPAAAHRRREVSRALASRALAS
jgi:hypothetical protein